MKISIRITWKFSCRSNIHCFNFLQTASDLFKKNLALSASIIFERRDAGVFSVNVSMITSVNTVTP